MRFSNLLYNFCDFLTSDVFPSSLNFKGIQTTSTWVDTCTKAGWKIDGILAVLPERCCWVCSFSLSWIHYFLHPTPSLSGDRKWGKQVNIPYRPLISSHLNARSRTNSLQALVTLNFNKLFISMCNHHFILFWMYVSCLLLFDVLYFLHLYHTLESFFLVCTNFEILVTIPPTI